MAQDTGSGSRRSEGIDELEHVVGELAGAVGGGQTLDQLQAAVAVLEPELITVDRQPACRARSVCVRAAGFKTTRTRGIP